MTTARKTPMLRRIKLYGWQAAQLKKDSILIATRRVHPDDRCERGYEMHADAIVHRLQDLRNRRARAARERAYYS